MIFFSCVISFAGAVQVLGKVFFINRTDSMPRGIYIRRDLDKIENGDIIVFRKAEINIDLIKYVSSVGPSEYCIDQNLTLWVNEISVATINTEKYPTERPDQSKCLPLLNGEILALGDHPNSYDSRYFGPVKISDVVARVELLWPFK